MRHGLALLLAGNMMMLLMAIPLLINVIAIWRWRGAYRYLAVIPLPFLVLACWIDFRDGFHLGADFPVATMLATLPAMLFLFVVAAVMGFTQPGAEVNDS